MKAIAIHSRATAELDDAIGYYELQKKGLGLDLLSEVERVIASIQTNPSAGASYKKTGFRYRVTRRFRYVLYYTELTDCIWIAAIAHGSRRPGYWRRRKFE